MNHNLRNIVKELYSIPQGCSSSPDQRAALNKCIDDQCSGIEAGVFSLMPSPEVLSLIDEAYKELDKEEMLHLVGGDYRDSKDPRYAKYAPLDQWCNNFFGTFIG